MHNVIWTKNWESFANSFGAAAYMSVADDVLTVDNGSLTTSAYKYYSFPCDELSEVNIFVETKVVEGVAFIGVDFYNQADAQIESQSKKVEGSIFSPTSFKAISPKDTKYCRATFGTWGGNSTVAMYKIPQVYVSKGDGLPSICSAQIKFKGSDKSFSIITEYPYNGITGLEWDATKKCLNVNLDGSSAKYPSVFVVPIAPSHPSKYILIGENFPRNINRVQIYCKDTTDDSVVDLMTVSTNLYFNVLVLR